MNAIDFLLPLTSLCLMSVVPKMEAVGYDSAGPLTRNAQWQVLILLQRNQVVVAPSSRVILPLCQMLADLCFGANNDDGNRRSVENVTAEGRVGRTFEQAVSMATTQARTDCSCPSTSHQASSETPKHSCPSCRQ